MPVRLSEQVVRVSDVHSDKISFLWFFPDFPRLNFHEPRLGQHCSSRCYTASGITAIPACVCRKGENISHVGSFDEMKNNCRPPAVKGKTVNPHRRGPLAVSLSLAGRSRKNSGCRAPRGTNYTPNAGFSRCNATARSLPVYIRENKTNFRTDNNDNSTIRIVFFE